MKCSSVSNFTTWKFKELMHFDLINLAIWVYGLLLSCVFFSSGGFHALCCNPHFWFLFQVFRKEVVFLVDISASMKGNPLENVKTALLAALLKLSPVDRFNIIAFNESSSLFSPSLSLATKEMVEKASEWIRINLVAKGDTNISASLDQVTYSR